MSQTQDDDGSPGVRVDWSQSLWDLDISCVQSVVVRLNGYYLIKHSECYLKLTEIREDFKYKR